MQLMKGDHSYIFFCDVKNGYVCCLKGTDRGNYDILKSSSSITNQSQIIIGAVMDCQQYTSPGEDVTRGYKCYKVCFAIMYFHHWDLLTTVLPRSQVFHNVTSFFQYSVGTAVSVDEECWKGSNSELQKKGNFLLRLSLS